MPFESLRVAKVEAMTREMEIADSSQTVPVRGSTSAVHLTFTWGLLTKKLDASENRRLVWSAWG